MTTQRTEKPMIKRRKDLCIASSVSPLKPHDVIRQNETSRGDVGASSPALDITAYRGGRTMPFVGSIAIPSLQSTQNNSETWRPIGVIAAAIVAGVKK